MAKGKIIQFRRGRHTVSERQFILEVEGVSKKEDAEKYIESEVSWKSPAGKEIKGRISNVHGNKGLVRGVFEKGLPGQAIATEVEIKWH